MQGKTLQLQVMMYDDDDDINNDNKLRVKVDKALKNSDLLLYIISQILG